MKIGAMRRKITLQNFTTVRDRIGGITRAWSDIADARAAVHHIGLREFWDAYRIDGEADYIIKLRYRADFDRVGRVKLSDGKLLRIVSILNEDAKKRHITVAAKSVGVVDAN